MKKLIQFSPLLLVLFLVACTKKITTKNSVTIVDQPLSKLHYTISQKNVDSTYHLVVALRFKGNEQGNSKLNLPFEWGPAQNLQLGIINFEVQNAEIIDNGSRTKIIEYEPNAEIQIRYEVKQYFDWPFYEDHSLAYHPILQKDFFHFIGTGFFVYPAELGKKPYEVNIDWEGFPPNWTIHNSYATQKRSQKLIWKDTLGVEAVFVGGDFRIHEFKVKDKPVYIAMRGEKWNFTDQEFADLLKKVVNQQRQFWDDYGCDYYTVTLIPYMEGIQGTSYQGTGLQQAFALNATENSQLSDFAYLFSHEMMHEWIGMQIKNEDPEQYLYWFSEGFTDYFAYLNMYESGLLDFEQYVNSVNEIVAAYHISPARNAPNDEIADKMFTNYQVYGKMAYQRGAIFALYLDGKIQQQSKGKNNLKTPMKDLLNICRNGVQVSNELFIATMNKYLDSDLRPFFEKHIQNGVTLPIEEWMLGSETNVVQRKRQIYDLGFNFDESAAQKKIVEVNKKSNAYKAGIREGQALKGYSFYHGNTKETVAINVLKDGEEVVIKYFPIKEELGNLPQFEIK